MKLLLQGLRTPDSLVWLFILLLALMSMPLSVRAVPGCQVWTDAFNAEPNLFIADILIHPANIFDTKQADQDRKIHHLMNNLHSVTRPDVIRRKLLFKSGDRYEPSRLTDSERLLRSARYIKDAEIFPQQRCGDQVTIIVHTTDNWTLTPNISFGRSGGNNHFGVSLEEQNVLGWGKSLSLDYKHDHERDSFLFRYDDDQLLGSRQQFSLNLSDNSDGHYYRIGLTSPFYAIDTPNSWHIALEDSASETELYQYGETTETFAQDLQAVELGYAWNKRVEGDTSSRFQLGWHYEQKDIRSLDHPDNRVALDLSYPWLGFEYLENSYREMENLNTMGRIEDTAIGKHFTFRAGFLTKASGSDDNQLRLTGTLSDSFISTERQLGLVDLEVDTYLGQGTLSGGAVGLQARYYYMASEHSTFYLKSALQIADNLLPNEQYRLGSIQNLRGYPEGFQAGDKSAVFTTEYRYFFDKSPYQLFKLGAVAFADTGTAWGKGNDPDWVSDVGIGLRLVPVRSSSARVVHLDLAFPLDTEHGIEDLQFTIGTKTTF